MIYRRIEDFHTTIPYRDIYRRLGKKSIGVLVEEVDEEFQKWVREAFLLCEVKAAYAVCKIDRLEGGVVAFGEVEICSKNLSDFLVGCHHIVLMGVTVGEKIVGARDSLMKENPAKAVVFDATASEATDNALDKFQRLIAVTYSRSMGSLLKSRFSAGYGDLGIEVQKHFYDILDLKSIGIKIGGNFFMQPEKSVTAFSGFK